MEAKITFGNGKSIKAEKNGDSFITKQKPSFPDELGAVKIESEDGNREYEHAMLVECASIDGRYWFAFIEEDPQELRIRELEEEKDMLMECILEMSEVVYGD